LVSMRVDLAAKRCRGAVLLGYTRGRVVTDAPGSSQSASWLEPSLAKTIAARFISRGRWGALQNDTRLPTNLLRSFPNPLKPLVRSDCSEHSYPRVRGKHLALTGMVSLEDRVPRPAQIRVLEAKPSGLTRDALVLLRQGKGP
jgi:hypothetical protein